MSENKISINESTDIDQFVTFMVADATYGIEVIKIKEVLYLTKITEVPNTIPSMKGVIDLRGSVVPVIDIRIKFSFQERDFDEDTVILICEYNSSYIGLIVDSVSDVIDMALQNLQDLPEFSRANDINSDYVKGISRFDDNMIIILDVDKILTLEEFNRISENKSQH